MLHPSWPTAVPGSAKGLFLVVEDIDAARAELLSKGATSASHSISLASRGPRLPGSDPERGSYRSYAEFTDPDGNGWLLQEIKTRLPGRGLSLDVATLTELLRETEEHHGQYNRPLRSITGPSGMPPTSSPVSAGKRLTRQPGRPHSTRNATSCERRGRRPDYRAPAVLRRMRASLVLAAI